MAVSYLLVIAALCKQDLEKHDKTKDSTRLHVRHCLMQILESGVTCRCTSSLSATVGPGAGHAVSSVLLAVLAVAGLLYPTRGCEWLVRCCRGRQRNSRVHLCSIC